MNMKKLLLLLSLLTSFGAMAQKKYIMLWGAGSIIYVRGELPPGIDNSYSPNKYSVCEILNMLASNGYEVEKMCSSEEISFSFLLSKTVDTSNAIQMTTTDDEDVTEIARYNLQGIPVRKSEKGLQIIVYSNYTTKTVVIQ